MTDRQFFQSIKICPVCHKEKLYGQEKECLLCRTIKYSYSRNYRAKHPGYDKMKQKTKYHLRIEEHKCTNCGMQLEDSYEYKMCPRCLQRSKIRLKKSRETRGIGSLV